MKQVIMETEIGKIIAQVVDNGEYHDMYIYLEREDGIQVDLAVVDTNDKEKKLKAFVFGNIYQEDYTESFEWNVDDINELEF